MLKDIELGKTRPPYGTLPAHEDTGCSPQILPGSRDTAGSAARTNVALFPHRPVRLIILHAMVHGGVHNDALHSARREHRTRAQS